MCERLHCLPQPGSLWDQDAAIVNKLESALRAIDEVEMKKAEQT